MGTATLATLRRLQQWLAFLLGKSYCMDNGGPLLFIRRIPSPSRVSLGVSRGCFCLRTLIFEITSVCAAPGIGPALVPSKCSSRFFALAPAPAAAPRPLFHRPGPGFPPLGQGSLGGTQCERTVERSVSQG